MFYTDHLVICMICLLNGSLHSWPPLLVFTCGAELKNVLGEGEE